MAIWQYLLLFSSVLIGGFAATAGSGERYRRYLPLLLSFSGAYLLGIAALEMIPEVFGHATSTIGLWLLGGFFIQLVLEGFSQGVEHGHVHAHEQAGRGYALQVMLGLGLHALLEGLPLGAGGVVHELHTGHLHGSADRLLFGIVLHKLPAAFALGLLLTTSGYSRRFVWGCLLTFAALSPVGAMIGNWISLDHLWRDRILALVIGSFLHISTTILFEADGAHSHRISPKKFLVIIAGMGVAYATVH